MGSAPDQALAFFAGGDPQQALGKSATIEYLARQRRPGAAPAPAALAAQSAQQAAQAKVAKAREMVQSPAGQQQRAKHLLAGSIPVAGHRGQHHAPHARGRGRGDEVRPVLAIGGCRPGSDGEHPLGRACDFMLSTGGGTPAASWIEKGYDIAAWAQANASRLGTMYIIDRQRIWDVRMAPPAGPRWSAAGASRRTMTTTCTSRRSKRLRRPPP